MVKAQLYYSFVLFDNNKVVLDEAYNIVLFEREFFNFETIFLLPEVKNLIWDEADMFPGKANLVSKQVDRYMVIGKKCELYFLNIDFIKENVEKVLKVISNAPTAYPARDRNLDG